MNQLLSWRTKPNISSRLELWKHLLQFQSGFTVRMPPALTHEQCRKDMCCACGGRAGKRNITPALGERIRKWAQSTWNIDVVSHPVGICDTCRSRLLDCEREQTVNLKGRPGTQLRWSSFKLEDISVARGQKADSCSCKMCRARKTNCAGFGPSVKNVKI